MSTPKSNKPDASASSDDESVLQLGTTKRGSPERRAAREGERKRKQQSTTSSKKKKKKKKKNDNKSPTNSTKSSSSKVKVKKEEVKKVSRRKRFTQEEDQFLCRAFVNVSHNERRGADQRGELFWKKIHKKFTELYNSEAECAIVGAPRAWDQLQTRFYRQIQKNVNTFNPYFKSVKEKKPSGTPYHEYIDLAAEEYEQMEGGKFKFKHCVEILHQCPKFNPMLDDDDEEEEEEEEEDADDTNQNKSPKTPATPYNKIGSVMGDNLKRPMGSKKAKEKARTLASIGGIGSVAATIESTKIQSVNNLAASTRELSGVLENKERHDTWLRLAAMHEKLGNVDKALEYMNKVDEDVERIETEKKKSAENRVTNADTSPTTEGTSPPDAQENVSITSSGHKRCDQESYETPDELDDDDKNGDGNNGDGSGSKSSESSSEDEADIKNDSSGNRNDYDEQKNESSTNNRNGNKDDDSEALSYQRYIEERRLKKLAGKNQAGV